MSRIHLVERELESEVCSLFNRLGAQAQPGPEGKWDVELSFPSPFIRQASIDGGVDVPFQISARIVIEVKSKANRGADFEMCRQLNDWANEAWLAQEDYVSPIQIAADIKNAVAACHSDLEDALDDPEELKRLLKALPGSYPSPFRTILRAAEQATRVLTRRPKGVLVLNHEARKGASERTKNPFPQNVEQWAAQHGLAVISWLELIEIEKSVAAGQLDAFNVFCAILDTNGIVEAPIRYRWQRHCNNYMPLIFHERPNSMFPQKCPWFLREAL